MDKASTCCTAYTFGSYRETRKDNLPLNCLSAIHRGLSADNMRKNAHGLSKRSLMVGCALIGVGASIFAALPAAAQQKPNVVFILADNVGYGDLGPYGGTITSARCSTRSRNSKSRTTPSWSSRPTMDRRAGYFASLATWALPTWAMRVPSAASWAKRLRVRSRTFRFIRFRPARETQHYLLRRHVLDHGLSCRPLQRSSERIARRSAHRRRGSDGGASRQQ